MKNATLVFLVEKEQAKIIRVCLAMKKRGFGYGKWNGVGGKVEINESIEEAAKRETQEEINVTLIDLIKVGEIHFTWKNNPEWEQLVHVYISENWTGNISESEEMRPQWFSLDELPFKQMWSDDSYWLPEILNNHLIKARFCFEDENVISEHEVIKVDFLN